MGYAKHILVLTTKIYAPDDDTPPLVAWLESLDEKIRYRVKERLNRLRVGNFGDSKALKEGVFELRCHFGAGYRIYYGIDQGVVILLCGGDKDSQKKDIKMSKQFWKDYGAAHEIKKNY